MITLEILIEESVPDVDLGLLNVGYEIDPALVSDRSPSLWQEQLISPRQKSALIHVFDRSFIGSKSDRWLCEDVKEKDWTRFRFIEELEKDFARLVDRSIAASESGSIWIMTDAQFGPDKKLYCSQREKTFLAFYNRFGLRINSAIQIVEQSGV